MLFISINDVHGRHAGGTVNPFQHPQRNPSLLQLLLQGHGKYIIAQNGHFRDIAAHVLVVEGKVNAVAGQVVPIQLVIYVNAVVCQCNGPLHLLSPIT